MLFTEPTFLFLFLPVLLALYFASLGREHGAYGNVLLLIASIIFYAKGGGAWAHDKYDTDIMGTPVTFASASETRWGWMWGTGVEYAVTRNWSAKIEYDYLDFGTKDVTYDNTAINRAFFNPVSTKERIHLIKLGVNYRFGYGPVYAAY